MVGVDSIGGPGTVGATAAGTGVVGTRVAGTEVTGDRAGTGATTDAGTEARVGAGVGGGREVVVVVVIGGDQARHRSSTRRPSGKRATTVVEVVGVAEPRSTGTVEVDPAVDVMGPVVSRQNVAITSTIASA